MNEAARKGSIYCVPHPDSEVKTFWCAMQAVVIPFFWPPKKANIWPASNRLILSIFRPILEISKKRVNLNFSWTHFLIDEEETGLIAWDNSQVAFIPLFKFLLIFLEWEIWQIFFIFFLYRVLCHVCKI